MQLPFALQQDFPHVVTVFLETQQYKGGPEGGLLFVNYF